MAISMSSACLPICTTDARQSGNHMLDKAQAFADTQEV
jgi:hypothetical protein